MINKYLFNSYGVATNVQLVNGISKLQGDWVNFDVEVSADEQFLYFIDGLFEQNSSNPPKLIYSLLKRVMHVLNAWQTVAHS